MATTNNSIPVKYSPMTLGDFAAIAGRTPIQKSTSNRATTINKFTVPIISSNYVETSNFLVTGNTIGLGTIENGSIEHPPFLFANQFGISGQIDALVVSNSGNSVCSFTQTGLSVSKISSPTGTLDFSGNSITGISDINNSKYIYKITGTIVQTTTTVTSINVLQIPVSLDPGKTIGIWSINFSLLSFITGTVTYGYQTGSFYATVSSGTWTFSDVLNLSTSGTGTFNSPTISISTSGNYINLTVNQGTAINPINWIGLASILFIN
jgi:hypothetical protein